MANFTIEARIFDEATQSLGPVVTLALIKDGQFNPDLPDSLLVYQNAQWVYYQKRQADAEKKDPAAWLRARKFENSEDLSWDQVIINPKADNKYLYYFRGLVPDQLKAMSLQTPNILRQMNERKIACQGQLNREKEDIERKEQERIRALPVFPKKPDFPVKKTAIPTDKIYLIKAYVEVGFDDIPDMPEAFTDAGWWESTWALEQQELMAQILSPTKGQITLVNTNMPHSASELLTIKQARYSEMLAKMTPEEIDAYFGVVFQNEGDNKPTIGDVYYQIQKILHDKVYELRDQTGIDYTQRIDLSNLSPLMPSASGAVKVGEYVQKRKELINTELNDQAVVVLSNAFVEYTQNRTGDSIPIDDTLTMSQAVYLSHLLSNAEWKTENDETVRKNVEAIAWATQSISSDEFMDQLVREGNEHASWNDPQFNEMFQSTIKQRMEQYSTDFYDFEKKYYSILDVERLVTWYRDFCKFMGFESDLSSMNPLYKTTVEVSKNLDWNEIFTKKSKEEFIKEINVETLRYIIDFVPLKERYNILRLSQLPDKTDGECPSWYITWLKNTLPEDDFARFVDEKNPLDYSSVLTSAERLLAVAYSYPVATLEKALSHEGALEKFKEFFDSLLRLRHSHSYFVPLFNVLLNQKEYMSYIIDHIAVATASDPGKNVAREIGRPDSNFSRVFLKLPEDKRVDFLTNDKISALINDHIRFTILSYIRARLTDSEFNRYISHSNVKLSGFVKSVDELLQIYASYEDNNKVEFINRKDVQDIMLPLMTEEWLINELYMLNKRGGFMDVFLDLPIYFDHIVSLISESNSSDPYALSLREETPISKVHVLKLLKSDKVLERFRKEFKNDYLGAVLPYKRALSERDYAEFCKAEGVYDIINSNEVVNAKSVLNMAAYLPNGLRYQYIIQDAKKEALSNTFKIKHMDRLRDLLNTVSFAKIMKKEWMVDIALKIDLNDDLEESVNYVIESISSPPFKIDPDKDSDRYKKSVNEFYEKYVDFLCNLKPGTFIRLLVLRNNSEFPHFYDNFISYDKAKTTIKTISKTVVVLNAILDKISGELYSQTLLCDHSIGLIVERILALNKPGKNTSENSETQALNEALFTIFRTIKSETDLISLLTKLSKHESMPSDKLFSFLRTVHIKMGINLEKYDIYSAFEKDYIKKAIESCDFNTIAFIIGIVPLHEKEEYLDHLLTIDGHRRGLRDIDKFMTLIDGMKSAITSVQREYFIMNWLDKLTLVESIPLLKRLNEDKLLTDERSFDVLKSKGLIEKIKSDPTLMPHWEQIWFIALNNVGEDVMNSIDDDMMMVFIKKGDYTTLPKNCRKLHDICFRENPSYLVTFISYFSNFNVNQDENRFATQLLNLMSLIGHNEVGFLLNNDAFIDSLLKHDVSVGTSPTSTLFPKLFEQLDEDSSKILTEKLCSKAANISTIATLYSILAVKTISSDQKWHILARSPILKSVFQDDLLNALIYIAKPKESRAPKDRLIVLNALIESLTPSEPKESQYSWMYKSGQAAEERLSKDDLYKMLTDYFTDDELGKIGVRPNNTPSSGVL